MSVHVGPYFRCVAPLVNRVVNQNGLCTNEKCKNYGKSSPSFCPECGNPKGSMGVTKRVPTVAERDVREALGDADLLSNLWGEFSWSQQQKDGYETHIWVGNKWPEGYPRLPDYDDKEFSFHFITPRAVDNEMNVLYNAYTDAYAKLVELYGMENVTLEWGVINYAR